MSYDKLEKAFRTWSKKSDDAFERMKIAAEDIQTTSVVLAELMNQIDEEIYRLKTLRLDMENKAARNNNALNMIKHAFEEREIEVDREEE